MVTVYYVLHTLYYTIIYYTIRGHALLAPLLRCSAIGVALASIRPSSGVELPLSADVSANALIDAAPMILFMLPRDNAGAATHSRQSCLGAGPKCAR